MLMSLFFYFKKILGPVQKRALFINVAGLGLVGCLLDIFFARYFFVFPNPSAVLGIFFAGCPIEEYIFYITGFWFILLLYIFCDEWLLSKYNRSDREYSHHAHSLNKRLIFSFAHRGVWLLLGLVVAATGLKAWLDDSPGWFPSYFVFLAAIAYVPFVLFWEVCKKFVNFRALLVTLLFTSLISLIWEATLAIPRGYWGYQTPAMMGVFVPVWSHLPIEAVSVWFFCSFIVLTYEFTKIQIFRKDIK